MGKPEIIDCRASTKKETRRLNMAKGIYKRGKGKETAKKVITKILRSSLTHSTPFRLLSVFFFVLLITGISYAEPLEFKGFIMGMPKEEVEIKVRQKIIEYNKQQGYSAPSKYELDIACIGGACRYKEIIKDKNVVVRLFWGGDPPKLDLIFMSFNSDSYQVLKDALTEKYGQPHEVKKELLQNRMGAVFESEIATWKLKEGKIRIKKYGDTIEEGTVDIYSSEFSKGVQQEKEKRKALPGF